MDKSNNLPAETEFVYVLCAWYSDKSGFALLGVYRSLADADDRKKVLQAAGALMCVEYLKMPLDRVHKMEVC